MAGTVAEELDLQLERGYGGGIPPGRDSGGGDDGRGGGNGRRIPRRAYMTGITLAVAGIMMFFMALTSSFIGAPRHRHGLAGVRNAADSVGEARRFCCMRQPERWKWRGGNWRAA